MKLDLRFSENERQFNTTFCETSVIHDIQTGATFFPSVSDDGIISWTNDRELPNPEPVNIKGDNGDNGKSAYEIAVKNGYTGTETEWLASLVGAAGKDGTNGTNGTNGVDGANGKSAYEIALANGYKGSETEWLASLVGEKGAAGKDGTNGKDGVDGKDGTSVTVSSVSESTEDGGNNVVTFSDGKTLTVKNGKTGATGAAGANGASVTVSSVSESTDDGGKNIVTFSDGKTLTVKNGSKGSQGVQGIKGNNGTDGVSPTVGIEAITGGTKVIITDKNGVHEFNVMNGADGEPGSQGEKGDPTDVQQTTGQSTTAVMSQKAVTDEIDALKSDLTNFSLGIHTDGFLYIFHKGKPIGSGVSLPSGATGDVVGNVDSENNIIVTGVLADGTYTVKYEMEDGTTIDIGKLVLGSAEITNWIEEVGYTTDTRLSLSSGNTTAATDYECTGFIPAKIGDVLRVKNIDLTSENSTNIVFYDTNKNPIACNRSLHGTTLASFFATSDGNGINKGTIKNTGTLTFATDVAYIRIGSKSITADSILTVNQEIM